MDVAMEKIDMMRAMAKTRYKVLVVSQVAQFFTVWANDEQEAGELVVKEGQGRPAGQEGPEIIEVKVKEMGEPQEDNGAIVDNAQTELDPKVKPLIEVVRG